MMGGLYNLAALATLPTVAASAIAVAPNSPDYELLSAWNRRQNSLAVIESRGRFYATDHHSPAEGETYSDAEMAVYRLPAATLHGVLAKLWVALAHTIGPVRSEIDLVQFDAINRADLDDVAAFAKDFDFHQELLFRAIRDLTGIIRARHKAG